MSATKDFMFPRNIKVSEETFISRKGNEIMEEYFSGFERIFSSFNLKKCESRKRTFRQQMKNEWYQGFCDKIAVNLKAECVEREYVWLTGVEQDKF